MSSWLSNTQGVDESRYLPEDFFMDYEMRMGGCEGYITTFQGVKLGIDGLAVGLGRGMTFFNEYICQSTNIAFYSIMNNNSTKPVVWTCSRIMVNHRLIQPTSDRLHLSVALYSQVWVPWNWKCVGLFI